MRNRYLNNKISARLSTIEKLLINQNESMMAAKDFFMNTRELSVFELNEKIVEL